MFPHCPHLINFAWEFDGMFSTSAALMGRLLCVICNTNSFHYFLYAKLCIHNNPAGVGVLGDWGQLISPNRYINKQSVFWRRRSWADFDLVLSCHGYFMCYPFLCYFCTWCNLKKYGVCYCCFKNVIIELFVCFYSSFYYLATTRVYNVQNEKRMKLSNGTCQNNQLLKLGFSSRML